jgi:hypothetical protein
MELFWLFVPLAWLYAAFNLIRVPYKIFRLWSEPQKLRCFLSSGRLLRYAFGYAIIAPVPVVCTALMVSRNALDPTLSFPWAALWLFLVVAALALLIACVRPLFCWAAGRVARTKGNH